MLFISHDPGVVRHLCDRIAVMDLDPLVEIGASAEVYAAPRHPCTHALISAVPKLSAGKAVFTPIAGEIASPLDPPRPAALSVAPSA